MTLNNARGGELVSLHGSSRTSPMSPAGHLTLINGRVLGSPCKVLVCPADLTLTGGQYHFPAAPILPGAALAAHPCYSNTKEMI